MSAVEIVTSDTPRIVTVRDALQELLHVAAARDILKEHETSVKAFLHDEADRVEKETGTAANFDAKGVGRAYVTQPSLKPRVTDKKRVEEYAEQAGEGEPRQTLDSSALQHDLDTGQVPAELIQSLAEAGYVRTEWVLPEGWLDDLVAECELIDGVLVHTGTGEVVEGVELVAASRPTLTFRADSPARKRLVSRYSSRVAELP